MAHNIHQRADGSWAAYYAGKPAWHGLGEVGDAPLTAREAYSRVFQKRVITTVPAFARIRGKYVEVAETRFTADEKSGTVFAPVGADYPPISDLTVLNLLYAVTKSSRKRAAISSVFLLGNGARAAATLDLTRLLGDKALTVLRDKSAIEAFLVADWSHDGKGALSFLPATNRVDCNNMLTAARGAAESKGKLVRIIHAGSEATIAEQLAEAERILGFASTEVKASVKLLNQLAEIALPKPDAWFKDFTEVLVPMPDPGEGGKRLVSNREEVRDTLTALWQSSKTLVGVPKSPYRGLQAVAEYADHHRALRIVNAPDNARVAAERRFRSAIEGPSAEMKARALELIRQEFEVGVKVPVAVKRG
jgi:phage/plasmid-like protein (TIGR03299 family)